MTSNINLDILIAETSPIIHYGLAQCFKKIKDLNSKIWEVDTKNSLFEVISNNKIDLLVINPAFCGLLHPDDIRKNSYNQELKIFAIEIGKLNKTILSLYDENIHISDDINEIRNKITSILKINEDQGEEKENLSSREKEIISFVVKGFTNHEIADKLFLSVHTVMTHRRNIARKLQIHSATGLTIYAIVNKIVDLSEIKL